MTNKPIHVWDIEIRFFHWLLAAGVAGAWLSIQAGPPGMLTLHEILGFAIGIMLVFRFFWGLLGGQHTRFSGFVRGPRAVIGHLKSLLSGRPQRFIGHNPAGSAMIVVLLLLLLGVVLSGIAVMGGYEKSGPLSPFLTFAQGVQAREIHETLVNILLVLVGLHVAGVLLETVLLKENLVRSMLHGRKDPHLDAIGSATPGAAARPALAISLAAVVVAGASWAGLQFALMPAKGVPSLGHNPVYAKECGACHTPHHPSLLPASSWRLVMANLQDHFGDDASLPEDKRQAIETWLAGSSNLGWDTKAGQRIPATLKPDQPMRITESAFWTRRHRDIPENVFKSKLVGGKANCQACHVDAARGAFSRGGIAIPEEIH